ncbi:MAG: oligosaccharide flippase family protein [Prevotella sp.]|nr:oligosaccharide flippase family protein [Prevotella sp.]MBP5392786.1 oligosaccharide flippase family protein [Bacteroidaceae bacterium]
MDNNTNSSYHHILKYTSLFGSIQALNIFIGLVRNKLVALILGPGGIGLMSLFNSAIALLSNATNLGIATSSVKTLSELYEKGDEEQVKRHVRVIRQWALATAVIGFFACALAGPLLNNFSFTWGNHVKHFVLLAPTVAMLAITGGETAILKSARRLRNLAKVSVWNVFLALVFTTPIIYFYGQKGIIPTITLITFTQMLLTIRYSHRVFPWSFHFERSLWGEGLPMIRLGIAFVVAGVFGSGADFLIRASLNNIASLNMLGLYNAGFMMTITYAGMIFTSMETDYYPRLSAIGNDVHQMSNTVNHQVEVSLLMISPLLVAFSIGAPIIVQLLYSKEFLDVVPMIQITVLAMYLRAMKLPVAYLTLAKGDSKSYLFLEAYSAVVMVIAVVGGYMLFGLPGTGVGLLVTGLIDIIVINIFTRYKYHYKVSSTVFRFAKYQLPIALAVYAITCWLHGWLYWASGIVMGLLSLWISFRLFRQAR